MLGVRRRLPGWAIMILILATACSGVAQPGPNGATGLLEEVAFRSIEDIVEGELAITDFKNGTARLPVTTKIPVACSVVYGPTPDFGFLSLDDDMAGGAHAHHNPLLRNLEGETTYYYRLQGVDESGIVYLSEVMTFTTPAFGTQAGPTENLASPGRGAEIVGYSSAFGDSDLEGRWGAANAFDGDPGTEWSSQGDGNEAWVEVKLAQRARIEAIEFWSRSMGDGSSITLAFTVTTDVGEVYGPFAVPDASGSHSFDMDLETSRLRFDLMETTGGNTGIVDIAVYGEFVDQ